MKLQKVIILFELIPKKTSNSASYPVTPGLFHVFLARGTLAVFTLEDEQIVWTDKSSDGLFD